MKNKQIQHRENLGGKDINRLGHRGKITNTHVHDSSLSWLVTGIFTIKVATLYVFLAYNVK